jgi:hypothetical protein
MGGHGKRQGRLPGPRPNTGLGLGLALGGAYNFTPSLAVYAGFSRLSFGVEGGGDLDLVDSGLNAGLRYTLPVVGRTLVPYLRGGLVYHQLSIDTPFGRSSSDYGLGFDIGGGLAVPLSPRFSLQPSVSYVAYSPNIDGRSSNVSYFTMGAGLGYRF